MRRIIYFVFLVPILFQSCSSERIKGKTWEDGSTVSPTTGNCLKLCYCTKNRIEFTQKKIQDQSFYAQKD
ncbi:MAG: hypothetical protein LBK58_08400 [Prevotellaceae bacterium]|jgi:hypothetical protein|nr:hypothetical protein [Prevotellaceae bacterium]